MSSPEKVKEIAASAIKGDKQAVSQLADIYSGRLYGYFYRLTYNSDDARELLSELFLKMVEKIGSARAETFEAWLFKTASNLFMDHLRAKKRRQKLFNDLTEDSPPEIQVEKRNDLTDKLTMQLRKLDPETAEIIVMRYYSQMSFEELAKMRNEPIGTVLSKVHRGLKKLRQLMENTND